MRKREEEERRREELKAKKLQELEEKRRKREAKEKKVAENQAALKEQELEKKKKLKVSGTCKQNSKVQSANFVQFEDHFLNTFKRDKNCSLVPRLPDLFNVAREKRGSLVKLITCVTSGGTNFHIWYNSELAGSRDGISHRNSI